MVWHDEPSEIDAETAEAYWDHIRLLASNSPEDREAGKQLNWACEDVTEALAFGDGRSVHALVTLSSSAVTPSQLEHLGAVLLPESLEVHDARLLDTLAESIGRTPRLHAALAFVTWDSLSDDATGRLHPLADDTP